MTVKFKNGYSVNCTAPTEQRVFKGSDAVGWVMQFNLIGPLVSDDLDCILSPENISDLTFLAAAGYELFTLRGYDKVSSTTIKYTENKASTIEIQMTKGV